MVRGRGYAKSIADFENIVVSASESGTPIRIRDIGRVTVGPDLRRGLADLDGNGDGGAGEANIAAAVVACWSSRILTNRPFTLTIAGGPLAGAG